MVDVVEAEGGVKRTSFRYTLCLSRGPLGSVAKVQYITDKILACVDIYGARGYVRHVTGKILACVNICGAWGFVQYVTG